MTGRRHEPRNANCTCAGTSPGFPQHEDFCGLPEVEYRPTAEDRADWARIEAEWARQDAEQDRKGQAA